MSAKVEKLMALATHPNTPAEEARTAAMAAVKLIQSQGLLGKTQPEGAFHKAYREGNYGNAPPPPPTDFWSDMSDIMRRAREARER